MTVPAFKPPDPDPRPYCTACNGTGAATPWPICPVCSGSGELHSLRQHRQALVNEEYRVRGSLTLLFVGLIPYLLIAALVVIAVLWVF